MLRDITLGQYYPADSVIHKLDPRVKLMATLVYIMSLFTFRGAAGFILATVFMIVVIRLSKVPFSYMVKGLKLSLIHIWCDRRTVSRIYVSNRSCIRT